MRVERFLINRGSWWGGVGVGGGGVGVGVCGVVVVVWGCVVGGVGVVVGGVVFLVLLVFLPRVVRLLLILCILFVRNGLPGRCYCSIF